MRLKVTMIFEIPDSEIKERGIDSHCDLENYIPLFIANNIDIDDEEGGPIIWSYEFLRNK